jgi:hypothetical protein
LSFQEKKYAGQENYDWKMFWLTIDVNQTSVLKVTKFQHHFGVKKKNLKVFIFCEFCPPMFASYSSEGTLFFPYDY